MRRLLLGACTTLAGLSVAMLSAPGCGSDSAGDGGGGPAEGCVGLFCDDTDGSAPPADQKCINGACQTICEGGGDTTLSGTVYDPAGKVPIYNALVYVPSTATAEPLGEGAACDRCDAAVKNPITLAATDTSGAFVLKNVPVGGTIPLVVQIGKWRRVVEIASDKRCEDTPIDAGLTRLPRNRAEGDIPRMAVATGSADPLQCLLKKIGIDDAEFGVAGTDARIHLYKGGGHVRDSVYKEASGKFAGGPDFVDAETLWGSVDELKKYDVVLLACEGSENDTIDSAPHKPDGAKQAVYDYAKAGGRLFTTHFHHTFFSSSPDPAPRGVATWTTSILPDPAPGNPETTPVLADIVGTFPKAVAMKEWLQKQDALEGGKLSLLDARHNVDAVNPTGLAWIQAPSNPSLSGTPPHAVQYLSFNAPVGAPDDEVCGRVVFSNLHVGAGTEGALQDDATADFPTSCQTKNLNAQQKALEFMLFDLSSCVQNDTRPPVLPK